MLSLLRRKARLLVLDDDASMQRLIAAILRGGGYRVDVVSNAEQALEKITRVGYAALLLDLMTPTTGGMTVIRRLKETNPRLLKRVVLVTASPDTLLRSVEGEVAAIVQKPFEKQALLDAVMRVVESA